MTPCVVVTVVTNGAGTVLANADGTVRSCQPDGTWQTRPAGTAGPFEQCLIAGNVAVYNPAGTQPILFAYTPSVPNASGGALGATPL